MEMYPQILTLLHSERPKLYVSLAFLSAIGIMYGIVILGSMPKRVMSESIFQKEYVTLLITIKIRVDFLS